MIAIADIIILVLAIATAYMSMLIFRMLKGDKMCLFLAIGFWYIVAIRATVVGTNFGLWYVSDHTIRTLVLPSYVMWLLGVAGLYICVKNYLQR